MRLLAEFRHSLSGGLPRLVPTGLTTLADVAGCGEDLAKVGSTISGESGGPQRPEGEGLVVEQLVLGLAMPVVSALVGLLLGCVT